MQVIDQILEGYGRVPVLSHQQQLETARLVRNWLDWNGGPEEAPRGVQRAGLRAKQRLIETNMRLVVSIARKYNNRGLPLEDLLQEGALGLNRAIELFDPARGYAFSTFAYWWVRQAMTRALSTLKDVIRIPCNMQDKVRQAEAFVRQQDHLGRRASDQEICQAVGVNPEKLETMRLAMTRRTVYSLDRPVANDSDSSGLGELLADPRSSVDALETLDGEFQREQVAELLPGLEEPERTVIVRYYFLGETQKEIAADLGVSVERVRKLQHAAVTKLRLWVAIDGQAALLEPLHSPAAAADAGHWHLPSDAVVEQPLLLEVVTVATLPRQKRQKRRRRDHSGQLSLV